MSFFDELQQASFRGVPFGVLGDEGRFGRRVAVHQYPKRDKPYVEDMGRGIRRINVVGFLVEDSLVYGGGSVIGQRDAMIAAAEQPGPGTLIHPTLGSLQVSVPEGGLGIIGQWEKGRYFELSFNFIESGDRVFPSISTDSTSALGSLTDSLGLSAAKDFLNSLTQPISLGLGVVEGVISLGTGIVSQVVSVAAGFAELAGRAARDISNLTQLSSLVTGNVGRYAGAQTTSAFRAQQLTSGGGEVAISDLLVQATLRRQAVDDASTALQASAAALDASSLPAFPATVLALTTAVQAIVADPRDCVRVLIPLASFVPSAYTGTGQLGAGRKVAQDAFSALCRRSALSAVVTLASQAQPASYDDAAALRDAVLALIDNEIEIAGDTDDDASYLALRAVRKGIASSLTDRGGSLAHLTRFEFRQPLPALLLAQRLYQDVARSDQLVSEGNPVHPAFMPLSLRALAS